MSAEHFDVIVVGAGIVGLAHALEAVRRGLKVCVLDRDASCTGASVRNFGFVTVTGQQAGQTWQRAMHSRNVWHEIAPQVGIQVIHRGLWLVARRQEAAAVLQAFLKTEMGEACSLLHVQDAAERAPSLALEHAQAVLYSPHELRIESRDAIGQLTRWLADQHGVAFRFGCTALHVDTPWVATTQGRLRAERIVVCPGADIRSLFPEVFARRRVTLCKLQMLRVRPDAGFRLPGSVMSDLSLVRYRGYADLPEARALAEVLAHEERAALDHGVHLIAVQSADGSLVVGDSHHYGPSPSPFNDEAVDEIILRHLREAVHTERLDVLERWSGVYPSATEASFIDAPDAAVRVVSVTSGTGASTAFGIARDVFDQWEHIKETKDERAA
ncbi:FAD-dependent oxidoreductase [beta proteobacterium AAP99]|nr:FAD-dependent oxidoreductase [beta proteobacterium AAP99]